MYDGSSFFVCKNPKRLPIADSHSEDETILLGLGDFSENNL